MIEINKRGNQELIIDNHHLAISNLGKVFWPDEGLTKGDLLRYYEKMAPMILPYLADRPESMNRFPNGILGKNFYQKNIDHQAPDWAETIEIDSEEKQVNYLLCQNKETLLFMINMGCIELNPWNSRRDKLDYPDYLVIDLDPVEIKFDYVKKAALLVKETLDELGVNGYPKTSGATGIHIYIPLSGKFKYEQARLFGEILANLIYEKAPDFLSLERRPKKRIGRVYLDYLQNSRGQTLASVYSVRPLPGAPVSTPLFWDELERKDLMPRTYNLKNIFKRVSELGDIFKPVIEEGINIEQILELIRNKK